MEQKPYNFTFLDVAPVGFMPILISGAETINLKRQKFLLIEYVKDSVVFEIRYSYSCSPFSEAAIADNILAIGFEGFFYLYDTSTQKNVLTLEMDGYFGNLYLHNKLFFVADARGLYCINKQGNIIWQNKSLGIDGVIIHTFENNAITGEGEFDPSGGWANFKLDLNTGTKIS